MGDGLVFVMRHGKDSGHDLSDEGKAQVRSAAENINLKARIYDISIEDIYTSPAHRAVQSAEVLKARFLEPLMHSQVEIFVKDNPAIYLKNELDPTAQYAHKAELEALVRTAPEGSVLVTHLNIIEEIARMYGRPLQSVGNGKVILVNRHENSYEGPF
jgi:phosphohistidine phosphatase SixA